MPTREYLEALHNNTGAVFTCGQLEKGENGTLHIQFYVNYKDPKRFSAMKKIDAAAHWEVVKVNNAAISYVLKEDTRVDGPYEFGVRPKVNQ